MSKSKDIKIKKAKGRPMLTWVGKRPLTQVRAYPAQHVERFDAGAEASAEVDWSDWPEKYEQGGLLFHGDNKDVLAHLLANGFRGKVKLIYIDPPFDSGADYVRKVQLRGVSGSQKIDGEEYTLGEQIQYTDIWANDNYLQFMYERLLMLRELLSEDGAMYLHCDWKKVHHLRALLDEVFGPENFRNEIVWAYPGREMHIRHKFNSKHDILLFVAKSDSHAINMSAVAVKYDREKRLKGLRRKIHTDPDGREWVWETRAQSAGQEPYKRYVDDIIGPGRALNDVWTDVQFLRGNDPSRQGFPTEKPSGLVERIVKASSNSGDLVLDCFIGSGTTADVAQKLGRRWIGCDINKGAIQISSKRLQAVMEDQAKEVRKPVQGRLDDSELETFKPSQFSFSTWRVNDYDLQVQHNEAVNLACEFIGITRNRAESYFDGTHGKRLVKIVPFNHPLTPLDIEDLKRELDKRPREERDIEVVCLGMEAIAREAVDHHNRNRAKGPNRIHVIELRTDEKYGGFIQHEPLEAKVAIKKKNKKLYVEVLEVFSPTIVKRLNLEKGLFKAQIDDWRAVVDCVMIDSDHDGKVFNVALSDVPEKKTTW